MLMLLSLILSVLSIPSNYTMMVMSGPQVPHTACEPNELAQPIIPALVDSAIAIQPDVVLITGDLTRSGQQNELDNIATELHRLHAANIPVALIPGEQESTPEFDATFQFLNEPFMMRREDPISQSYMIQLAPRLSLIGLRATLDTTWRISSSTLAWMTSVADSAINAGDRVILLSHFPIVEPADFLSDVAPEMVIDFHRDIVDTLIEHRIPFVLSGHYPVLNMTRYIDDQQRYVAEVSSASPVLYPCAFRLVSLSDSLSTFTCETRYIHSLPQHPNLQAEARQWIEPKIGTVCVPGCVEYYWGKRDTLGQMIEDMEVEPLVEAILNLFAGGKKGLTELVFDLLNALPNTEEGRASYINQFFGEDLGQLGIIHLNGNEWETNATNLIDAIYDDAKDMIYDLIEKAYPAWYQAAKRGTLKTTVATAIPIIKKIDGVKRLYNSFLGDYTRYDKYNQDQTNDLYKTFYLDKLPFINDQPALYHTPTLDIPPRKFILEGQLLIEKNGIIYNTQGNML